MPAWKKLMMVILVGPKGSLIVGVGLIRKLYPDFSLSYYTVVKALLGITIWAVYRKLLDHRYKTSSDIMVTKHKSPMHKYFSHGMRSLLELGTIFGSMYLS